MNEDRTDPQDPRQSCRPSHPSRVDAGRLARPGAGRVRMGADHTAGDQPRNGSRAASGGGDEAGRGGEGSQHRPGVDQRGRRLDVRLLLPRHQAGDRGPHPPALRRALRQARRPGRRADRPLRDRRHLEQPPDRPHGLGQRDRVGPEDLVRVRRLRPALRRPLGGPHDVRPLHRLHQPQQRLRHGPGARLRGRLQRRQAPRPLRAQPDLPRSPSSSTARPTPAPTRASTPRSASPPATPSSPSPRIPLAVSVPLRGRPEPQRLLRVRHRLGRHLRLLLGRGHRVRAARLHPAGVRQVARSRAASRCSTSATTSRPSTTATRSRSSAPSAWPSRTEPWEPTDPRPRRATRRLDPGRRRATDGGPLTPAALADRGHRRPRPVADAGARRRRPTPAARWRRRRTPPARESTWSPGSGRTRP